MSFLRSLPADAGLLRVFQAFPETARPLIDYHEALLRGESPFSVAQRELIAAYVSGLNACAYCHGVHTQTAIALGVDPNLLNDLLSNPETAHVEESMRPVLAFVRKLTLARSKMIQSDADAVFSSGWNDRALYDAISVCALFNFMNRLVDGLSIDAAASYVSFAAQRLAQGGYGQLRDMISNAS